MTSGLGVDLAGLAAHVGSHLGFSEWREMTQERVDAFADVTEDHNYIHVDPRRAAAGPFGRTVAHGYLTLSLLAPLIGEVLRVRGAGTAVNYGLDRLRFPAPVPVGSRFRAGVELLEVADVPGGVHVKMLATVEVEGATKPSLVAEVLFRYST